MPTPGFGSIGPGERAWTQTGALPPLSFQDTYYTCNSYQRSTVLSSLALQCCGQQGVKLVMNTRPLLKIRTFKYFLWVHRINENTNITGKIWIILSKDNKDNIYYMCNSLSARSPLQRLVILQTRENWEEPLPYNTGAMGPVVF